MSAQVILVVGDEAQVRAATARLLVRADRSLAESTFADAEQALARPFDAIVADAGETSREIVALLHVVHERSPELPVVAIGRPATTVEALRHGAFAAALREQDPIVLSNAVDRAVRSHALAREVLRLRREVRGVRDRVPLLGRSERTRELSRQVDDLCAKAVPVLLVGATGTGKTLVAREIHARSPRASGPFVSVSCAGVKELLLESRLFGHRRGAFPGAIHDHEGALRSATGGTIYVERLETLPVPLQARLVAVLHSSEALAMGSSQPVPVDVRFLFGSNRDLTPLLRAGTFRDDLYRRLQSASIRLPTLAERPEDVLFLAEAFAAEAAENFGVAPRRFDADAQAALQAYRWPGNVRELRECIEAAFARGVGETVRVEHLPSAVRAGARSGQARDPERLPTLAEAEAELVGIVLEESGGNKTEAARRLGIDRKRLYRKIRKYGLLGAGEVLEDDDDDGS